MKPRSKIFDARGFDFVRGLRGRTAILFLAVVLSSMALAGGLGLRIVTDIRADLGTALARDNALKSQQKAEAEIGRDLALARRLADSAATLDWLADESQPEKRRRFVREAEGYRQAFTGRGYFAAVARTLHFHYADNQHAPEPELGYTLRADKPENAWYFKTLSEPDGVWINVDFDKHFAVTNVWINVRAQDGAGRALGVVGTGIDLRHFLAEVLGSRDSGVITMLVDDSGVIVAHPDPNRMAYDLAGQAESDKTLAHLAASAADAAALGQALAATRVTPGVVPTLMAGMEDGSRAVAMARVVNLGWTVVTLVDPRAVAGFRSGPAIAVAASASAVLILALLGAMVGFDRLVLHPLVALTALVRRLARGEYDDRPPSPRRDEIGQLARAFDDMAHRVRAHSEHLERLVDERTAALAETNQRMAQTHRALTDSIDYASLIQSALLPGRRARDRLPDGCFVLWRPRDVVGGDLYLHRRRDGCHLFGVADCAGHGVPGACMTMLAHAVLQVALGDTAWDDPAAILRRVDERMREALPDDGGRGAPATNMDLGLVFADPAHGRLVFAGARIDLFWSEPGRCERIPGGRRSLNDRKPGAYANSVLALRPERTYLLTTDGLLDQAGGERGHGFGASRFAAWAAEASALTIEEQGAALATAFDRYRGDQTQRDDVTVLAFRFEAGIQSSTPVEETERS